MKIIDAQTSGAWILHHDQRLASAQTTEFENIALAGRSSRLLSAISRERQWEVSTDRVNELARANGIRAHEVAGLLATLESHELIDKSATGVSILGVSQAKLLEYADEIFQAQNPDPIELASLALAELSSSSPISRNDCAEELADTHRLSRNQLNDLFDLSERIAFVDYEQVVDERVYFNGALYKRDNAAKAKATLDSLSATESASLSEFEGKLSAQGCLPMENAVAVLGQVLWSKLLQIGFYEVSTIKNEYGESSFVTKPSALAKFVPNGLADMLDDAKALASSFSYGIMKSFHERGQIRDPQALIGALLTRDIVSPIAAIVQDYQILERRGVVQVTNEGRNNRLSLLKPEIGRMARDLIISGDASVRAAHVAVSASSANFIGPENRRKAERLQPIPETKASVKKTLDILRKSFR